MTNPARTNLGAIWTMLRDAMLRTAPQHEAEAFQSPLVVTLSPCGGGEAAVRFGDFQNAYHAILFFASKCSMLVTHARIPTIRSRVANGAAVQRTGATTIDWRWQLCRATLRQTA